MYKIILAIRYLLRRRITYLALAAVALCVFMVVIVMTIMAGLVRDFESKNHIWAGDCILSTDSLVGFPYYAEFAEKLRKEDFVEAVSPVIRSYGILTYEKWDFHSAVEIMGVGPVEHSKVGGFGDSLYYRKGQPSCAFEPSYDSNLPGIVVGIDRFRERDQRGQYHHESYVPKYAFSVSCFPLTAKGALAKAGLGLVNTKRFYYSDDSHSGLARVDGWFVYLLFEQAQSLCGMDTGQKRASAIHIKFEQGTELQSGRDRVASLWEEFVERRSGVAGAELLGNVHVETFREFQRESTAAVEMERTMMIFVFCLIGIITVFVVFVVLYMIVSHKSKDIGILKSVGVMNIDIIKLFLFFAFLLGALGSAVGTAGGVVFLGRINQIEGWLYEHYGFQLWNRMLYAIDDIPNTVDLKVLTGIILSAIAACLLGALVPSWQAARCEPVETLQVNQL